MTLKSKKLPTLGVHYNAIPDPEPTLPDPRNRNITTSQIYDKPIITNSITINIYHSQLQTVFPGFVCPSSTAAWCSSEASHNHNKLTVTTCNIRTESKMSSIPHEASLTLKMSPLYPYVRSCMYEVMIYECQ